MAAEERTPRINLLLPETENTTWEQEVENWAKKLDESSANAITFYMGGEAIDEEILFDDFLFDEKVNITKVAMYARVGPTGDSFQVDFLKNGAEQGKSVSISAGQKSGSGAIVGLSYDPTAGTPEKMGLKVKNIGSTIPGSEINIIVHYNVQPVIVP